MYTDHAAAAAAATALCGDLSRSKSFRMKQVASLVVKDKQIQEKMLAAMSKSQAAAPVGTESLEFDLHEKMQLRATAQLPRGIRRTLQRRRTLLYHLFILVMGVLVGLIAFTLSKVNRFSVPRIRPFASQPACLPAPPGVSLCAPPHACFLCLPRVLLPRASRLRRSQSCPRPSGRGCEKRCIAVIYCLAGCDWWPPAAASWRWRRP